MRSGDTIIDSSPPALTSAKAPEASGRRELRECLLSGLLLRAYRTPKLGRHCVSLALRMEGGSFFSATLRRILRVYHGVQVGAYSYGECMIPGVFPGGVTVGRYVSVANGVRVLLRNHPYERLSMHPFFYNHALGVVTHDTIAQGALTIEDDVWIGERAIITPGCRRIGLGAVVGAGAVVTHDVADFTIVAGNPARPIRRRFDDATCDLIRASRWWQRPIEDCVACIEHMVRPLNGSASLHPLLSAPRTRQE